MLIQEGIDAQKQLLDAHRKTLNHFLRQEAQCSSSFVPPHVLSGIDEARQAILDIKMVLRQSNVHVDDHPDDEARPQSAYIPPSPQRSNLPLDIIIDATESPAKPKTYERKVTELILGTVFSLASSLLGVALLILAAGLNFRIIAAGSMPASLFLVFGLIALVYGASAAWDTYLDRDSHIMVFSDRLEVRKHGKTHMYPWRRVTKVWVETYDLFADSRRKRDFSDMNQPQWRSTPYRLMMDNGEVLVLDTSYKNLTDLQDSIRSHVWRELFPRYQKELEQGHTITFGRDLGLNREAIRITNTAIPIWNVCSASLNELKTELIIQGMNPSDSWRVRLSKETFNFFVFIEIVNAMVARQFAVDCVKTIA